MDELRRNFQSR